MGYDTSAPDYLDGGVLTDSEAWVAIASATSDGSTALITFTSGTGKANFSQYMDFVLVSYMKSTGSGTYATMQFNNNTNTMYYYQYGYSNGTGGSSGLLAGRGAVANANVCWYPVSSNADIFGSSIVRIYDVNSGKNKSWVFQGAANDDTNAATGYCIMEAGTLQRSMPAITEIDIKDAGNSNLAAGTRVDLFGILPRMVTA